MSNFPFYLVFCQSLPEMALVTALGMILIGLRPGWKNVLKIALIGAVASYCIRMLPLPPGVNVLIQVPVLIVLIVYCCKIDLFAAALAVLLGLIVLSVAEGIFNALTFKLSGITCEQAYADPLLRVLFPLPEYIFLAFLTFITNRYRFIFINIQELRDLEVQVKGRAKK